MSQERDRPERKKGGKPLWRPSGRVPMGRAGLKATLISCTLFGLLFLFSASYVVFRAIEQQGIQFAPAAAFERPVLQLKTRTPKAVDRAPRPGRAAYSETVKAVFPVEDDAVPAGVLSDGAGFEMLAEMPDAKVQVEESLRTGLMAYRNEVRLGGSWENLDGSGNEIPRPQAVEAVPRQITLYAVIFRMTINHAGQLVDFELEKVVDPRTQPNNVVAIDIPARYIQLARGHAAARDAESVPNEGELLEVYDYFFYNPLRPDDIILSDAWK